MGSQNNIKYRSEFWVNRTQRYGAQPNHSQAVASWFATDAQPTKLLAPNLFVSSEIPSL